MSPLDFSDLDRLLDEHFVTVRTHPEHDLFIYNYTARCVYEKSWTRLTMACRGLVLDGERNVVARGLPKFMNYQELPCIPADGPLTVQEKCDGSLIQVLNYQGDTIVTSRGSFDSPQALTAKRILAEKYPQCGWPEDGLYLFELISPENRIVVDYGEMEDLIHLAAFHGPTGEEMPCLHEAFLRPRMWFVDSFEDVFKLPQPQNEEGYVARWPDGFRVKVKFAEYVRLHKLLTGLTPTKIWECLAAGQELHTTLEGVPDEFYDWALGVASGLITEHEGIRRDGEDAFAALGQCGLLTRKQWAHLIQMEPYPAVLFHLLDGKDPSPIIWKLVKPREAGRPFRCGETE